MNHEIDALRQQSNLRAAATLQRAYPMWRLSRIRPYLAIMNIKIRFKHAIPAAIAVLALGTTPSSASSQAVTADTRLASRAELEAAATALDQWAASSAYNVRTRNRARTAASDLRARLANGDFRVGDRILLHVEGQLMIDDTVTVREGKRITIRGLTEVSLAGVLRSELTERLAGAVTQVQRTATVLARPLTRVAVFGEVVSPGYYAVPGEATIDQIISRAGGPSPLAAPGNTELMRGDTVLFEGDEVVSAIAGGQTLDALDLRDGDVIQVPARRPPWDRQMTFQVATFLLAPVMAAFLVGGN